MRILSLVCCAALAAPAATPVEVTFEGPVSQHMWTLPDLNRDLPSDWSGYRYLVIEFRASSPQRFEFLLNTPGGAARALMHPYAGAWVRAALDLEWFKHTPNQGVDMAAAGNRSRPGYFVSLWGPFKTLNQVTGIGVRMVDVIGKPEFQIRSVRVAKESPGDAVLEDRALVDEFGQWKNDEWPGKAKAVGDLQRDWSAEEGKLKAEGFEVCGFGGFKATKAGATGKFRVEQVGGKWWLVDPDGHLFWSAGIDVIEPGIQTPVKGREALFPALPPDGSFLTWNLERRFGADWRTKWVDLTLRRMDAWGFNTIGDWSNPSLSAAHRKPYTVQLEGWQTKVSYMGLPDVYSDEFVQQANAAAARQCSRRKDDPWLVGYFMANEPPWPNRESVVVDLILQGPKTATQQEAVRWLRAGDTPERRKEFIYHAFERYIEVVNAAVKKADPNHLNLGMRFGGHPPDAMSRAAKAFDVYSINIYDYVPDRAALDRAYALAGKPFLIGEFHFGTPGRGMAASLKQVRDQKERGVAYRYYVEQSAAYPAVIGAHWFQWMDEPSTGREDGENYNIGFVDVTDRPYSDLVDAAIATHKRLRAIHAGEEQPVGQTAQIR